MLKTVVVVLFCLGAAMCADDREPSTCEEDRARRLNATVTTESILHLVPDCDENGDYAAKQCFTNNDWCVCYRRNGENINTPSKNIKACDCVRARDDALQSGDAYKPICERTGYYRPKQCQRSECWCVDRDGKVLTDPKTGDVEC